jgi:3-isopropylmalate/(R)-2-methylmalate dehydratase small subunit
MPLPKFDAPFTAKAVPLAMENIDTDMIIPAEFLTSISRDGYGKNLFRRLRDSRPDFPLSQPRFAGAGILIAGKNFGCGSSREHAVWALRDAGFQAVVAPSFADIFASNSGKNGLLLAALEQSAVDRLLALAADGTLQLTVDLEAQTVAAPGGLSAKFPCDGFLKHCLQRGLDDMDYLLSHKAEIEAHRRASRRTQFVAPSRA